MRTISKPTLMTFGRLAELQHEGYIYLDDSFQSNCRWTTVLNQAYMKSILLGHAVTPIILGDVDSLTSSCKLYYGEDSEEYKFFKDLQDQGYKYITIDGNNRDNCICAFINDEFPLTEGVYDIEELDLPRFTAGKNDKTYSQLPANVKQYVEGVKINILLITQCDRIGLAALFSKVNEGLNLNDQEKRNAIMCRFGHMIRNLVKENLDAFKKMYSQKNINRRHPDEFCVSVAVLVANGLVNLERQTRTNAYGDSTLEVRTFEKTKAIIKQIAYIVKNYGASGFNVGGKFNNNLIDFAMLLNYINSNNIVVDDWKKFYNYWVERQLDYINDATILLNNKKGTAPKPYAKCLSSNSKSTLNVRYQKQLDMISEVPDQVLTLRDETRLYDPKFRFMFWQRQNGICPLTNKPIEARFIYDGKVTHVDHTIPWSKGGQTNSENGALVFASANLEKGNKDMVDLEIEEL
tara:strand:- start:81 stop:1469 length:1389 start_codon:yes stop_codon:yes gene_type:complete